MEHASGKSPATFLCMSEATRIVIGKRIRELRKAEGLSQEKLSMMVNVERSYLAKVELGKRNLSIDCLERIVNGFGLSLRDFFQSI